MGITEKVAYLKGLAVGMDLKKDKKEGRLLAAMLDVMEDMALELRDLRREQEELTEEVDAVSSGLDDVEAALFGEEDGTGEECYATACPSCGRTIYFDETVLEDGGVICPDCGEKLEFKLEQDGEPPEDDSAPDTDDKSDTPDQ